jgi:hypothetical protein
MPAGWRGDALVRLQILVAILLLSGGPAAEQVSRGKPAAPALDLRCLSDDHSGCGCSLKIVSLSCPADHPTGWQAHFASELNDGAPLWLSLGGREMSLRSRRPVTNSFTFSEGDRWTEEYEGENLNVVIRYRPAKSTCPANKPDGCEYFDVAADITITARDRRAGSYKATGACGC